MPTRQRPLSASSMHGVRFSDEEWGPISGSRGGGGEVGLPQRPRSALGVRGRDLPERDQLRPTSAGSRRMVAMSSSTLISQSLRIPSVPQHGQRQWGDDSLEPTAGVDMGTSRMETHEPLGSGPSSRQRSRPAARSTAPSAEPHFLSGATMQPVTWRAWKSQASDRVDDSAGQAALLRFVNDVVHDDARGGFASQSACARPASALSGGTASAWGTTKHKTQEMALTASVFNQQLAAGLVPGRGRGLSKAVRYLCRVGHTMKLPDAGSNPELARLERYADKCAWRDRRKLEAWKSNPFNPSAHTARAYGSLRGGTMFGTKATSAVTHNDFAAYSRPRSAASRPASAISAAYRARPSSALSRSSRARGGVGQSSTSAAAPWSNTTFLESLSQSKAMVSLDLSGNGASVSFQGFRDDRGADASSGKTDHIPWGAASRVGEVLRACPLLQRIPGDALRQLATGCVQLTLDAGAVVCAEGQRGGCAYVLAQGRLALQRLDAGGGGGARQRAVGELDTTGDCVGELALLLGWPHPLTAVCASPVELVKVPCSALQNIIRAWPGVAALLAESVVEQRRSEDHGEQDDAEASLLVKVLGLSDSLVNQQRQNAQALGQADAHLTVDVRHEGWNVQRETRTLAALAATYDELPINEVVLLNVKQRDATVHVSFWIDQADGSVAEAGEASFAFADALAQRSWAVHLPIDAGGTVSALVSVQGMYTPGERALLSWLDKDHAELAALVRCGVRSRRDLEALSHSELLARMAAADVSAASRKRLAARLLAAKQGAGFLCPAARQLAARVRRFHRAPALPHEVPQSQVPKRSAWAGEMFARWLETDYLSEAGGGVYK